MPVPLSFHIAQNELIVDKTLPFSLPQISRQTAAMIFHEHIPFVLGGFRTPSLDPDGVQVDVLRYLQEIVVRINQIGLVSSLVKVTHPVVSLVEKGCVRYIEMPHEL